jgi:hypothetical protein
MARDFTTPGLLWASPTIWAPLAAGPDGVLHTARVESGGANVEYKRSYDNGATFTTAANIASSDTLQLERTLWVDPATNIVHIIYQRSLVLYHRRSTDGGTTWGSESAALHTASSGQFYRYGIEGDGAGKVHFVYAAINDC